MLATLAVSLALVSTASADLGRVVVLGDSLAAGTRLGPQVPGSILACGRSTGSYPQLALSRVKKSAAVDVSCNGGHAGVFSGSWTGMPANPDQYQYNDGTTIPPQYDSLNGSEQVVIIGSGGNEAYFGDSLYTCLGHSENYDLNKCAQVFGSDGAGLLARTQGSKTIMAGVLDTVHQKSPNAKIFLIGTPRIAPPDGVGCYPNPILTLADAPVWAVWEDSLRQSMSQIAAARSSYATFVDVQAVSGNTHTACAAPSMKWINSWTVENLTYPGLPNHNTPFGADAIADILVNAMKAAGLNTGTPNAPSLTRTTTTASPIQSFTYSGAAGSTFKCRLDNAAYAACPSSPVTLTGLANGPHTYSVTQTDGSGNVSPGSIVNFTVDNIAPTNPTLTRTSPTASPTNSPTQTFTYAGAESGGTFQCRLDSAAYSPCSASPMTISGLTTGSHTYYVTQTDAAGNVSPAQSVTWSVDVTPPGLPTVTRTNPTADPTKSTTQVITYSGAEAGGTFQCKLDNGSFGACSGSPVTLTGLGAGTHTYAVTQTDAVGNVGSATTVTWTIDLTAPGTPTVTRTNPSTSPTNSSTQVLTYSGAEAGGTFQCKLDSAAYAACPASPVTLSGLGAGSHLYSVTQTDAAGNVSAVAGTTSWTVDVTPPPVPNVSGPSGITALTTATILYSDSEAGVSFDCKLDAAAYADCTASPISLSGLAPGAHTYYVTATDAAGNVSAAGTATWTIDPNGFTSSISTNPSNPSTSPTAAFAFAASITAGTTYECKLDTGAFTSCTSPTTYNNLPDGTHTFTVHANNPSTSPTTTPDVSRTWVIDATPPSAPALSRTIPTANPTNFTSQTFSLTPAEAGGVLSCRLDNGAAATCPSSPITVAGLDNGVHTYSVTQTDAAGNTGSVATVSWTVDITPPSAPTVTRTAPTAVQTNLTSQTITYGGIEGGATTQCKLDTGAFGSCSASGFTLTGLGEGSHTFSITQTDSAGNTSPAGSVSWSIDSIPPGVPTLIRDVPTASPTNSTSQTLSFSAAEPGGTLKCKLDGGSYGTCLSSPVTLTALGNGQHTYSVTQTDATGNVSAVASVSWTVDTIAPASPGPIAFDHPAVTKDNFANVGYSPKEAGGVVQCQIDFGAWIPCAGNPLVLTNLEDGNHNVAIRQVDDAGNIGAGAQVTWLVDTVKPDAPTVTRTSPATSPTNQTTASITFAGGELTGTLLCKLDNASYSPCPSSPVALSGLSFATHTYSVTQTDAAGNVSLAGSTTWTVEPDTTPPPAPTVTRTSPTANPTASTSQTITYSAGEAGGTLKCKLDGAAYSTCTGSPISLSSLGDGSHTFSVTQTDSSNNVSQAGSVTWTVDTTAPAAPTIARTAPTGNPTPSTSQTITYSGEAGGTFQCKRDLENYAPCTGSPVTITGLTDGTHTYSVTQTDAAGNFGSAATVTWVVDTSAPSQPTVTRTSPTATPTNSTSQTFSYSGEPGGTFQCKLDAGSYSACASSPVTLTDLSDGVHSLSVTQTDGLGHVGQPTTVTWTVDTTPPNAPTVTRTSPTANPTNSTSQSMSYGGLEGGATVQCKLDSAAYAPCAATPITLSALPGGTHTYSVTQTDTAGNVSPAGAVSWVVDVTPPPTPNVSGPSGTTGLTSATISYNNAEAGVAFRCRLDSDAYAPCPASPINLTGITNGSHTYFVTATDPAGNVSAAGTATWTYDPFGFGVSITSAPSILSKDSTASFAFESTITAGTSFECKLDTGTFASCTSPKSYSGLSDGPHTFVVHALNGLDVTSDDRTWTVDSSVPGAPTVTRSNPTATPTSSTVQTLSFTGAEPGGTLSCKVNESDFLTCPASPVELSAVINQPLPDGTYTFSVRQTDAAGNTGPSTPVTWVVDTAAPAAPTVALLSPTVSPTTSTTQSISYTGEAGSSFECQLDGGSYAPCAASPVTLSGLSLGSHIFAVRQIDGAGNSSTASAVAWTIEAPAPPGPTDPVAPPNPPAEPELYAKVSAITPKAIKPARTGAPFSLKSRGSVGSFRVTLSAAATVSLRLERVVSGASRASSTWTKFKLKSGQSTIYLSGRANNRALPAGTYKVRLTIVGAKPDVLSKSFRIKR